VAVVTSGTTSPVEIASTRAPGARHLLWALWALVLGLGVLASWWTVAARGAARPSIAPTATLPVLGSASPPPLAAPEGPAASAAPVEAAGTPSSRPFGPSKKHAAGKANCAVPYTLDANGYRRYRRECFE